MFGQKFDNVISCFKDDLSYFYNIILNVNFKTLSSDWSTD